MHVLADKLLVSSTCQPGRGSDITINGLGIIKEEDRHNIPKAVDKFPNPSPDKMKVGLGGG